MSRLRVAVVGTPFVGDGYPHPTVMRRLLAESPAVDLADVSVPQPRGGYRRGGGVVGSLMAVLRLVVAARRSIVAWTAIPGRAETVYVPYPALPTLLWWSILRRRAKPRRLVADAFVGWYDAAIVDRALFSPRSIVARALRWAERRALGFADVVMTDTRENADALARQLDLPRARFRAAPLAIFEDRDGAAPAIARGGDVVEVVFVGTFVPLQGTPVIAAAIAALPSDLAIHFSFYGDGQDAARFAAALPTGALGGRVTWHRGFTPHETIVEAVRRADLCLGIFGTGEKAARVWPLKNYLALRLGRCLVTARTHGFWSSARPVDDRHACLVAPGDAQALAAAILALARDPARRARLAQAARAYYVDTLSNARARDQVVGALSGD